MASSRSDPVAPDINDGNLRRDATDIGGPEGVDMLKLVGSAEDLGREHQIEVLHRSLQKSYRAWRNEHAEGSKYIGGGWAGRSTIFTPKTRSTVRKAMATTAAAMFSTDDVVSVKAEYEDDDLQRAGAAVLGENLNVRLSHGNRVTSIPWFQTCMGASLDSAVTGVAVSKQYWQFREIETDEEEYYFVEQEDPETGERVYEEVAEPIMRTVRDRPMCELFPIENICIDPSAPWYDPIQESGWFIARVPMLLTDARAMVRSSGKMAADMWLPDITDEMLLKGRLDEERSATRRAREGGHDRYERTAHVSGLETIWLNENFIRIEGVDYHFWSVGRHEYLSPIRQVHEVYPEQEGERPFVFGVGQIDSHRLYPMGAVESWQPLQQEMNDLINLRLDALKRNIAPLAKVKRGKKVDLTQVQRRGRPDALLLLDDLNDVEFEKVAGPDAAAYNEVAIAGNSMDELSGTFSTGSVQSNRELNETVGGMRLLSGAANAIAEFDLRVFVETWAEPVLRQIVKMIRYYEADERMLAISGAKARVMEKFGVMPSLDDLENTAIMLRINVGIGAADPMQRLAKLKTVFVDMLLPILETLKAEGVDLNAEALVEEIFGIAGYRDGRRFFDFKDPEQQGPPPEMIKIMEELKLKAQEIEQKREKTTQDNETKVLLQEMKGQQDLVGKLMDYQNNRESREQADIHNSMGHMERMLSGTGGQEPQKPEREPKAPENLPAAPNRPEPNQIAGQAILQQLDQLSQQIKMVGGMMVQIRQEMQAPAKIIRGQDGRPAFMQKNGKTMRIVHDDQGRPIGTEPIGAQGIPLR